MRVTNDEGERTYYHIDDANGTARYSLPRLRGAFERPAADYKVFRLLFSQWRQDHLHLAQDGQRG